MVFGGPINRQRNNNFKKALERRLAKLKDFPPGTEVAYNFDKTVSVGTVLSHDHVQGRLETNQGGSHNPLEMTTVAKT